MKISIAAADLDRMRKAAVEAFPKECCGLLVGIEEPNGYAVSRVVPTANVFDGNQHDRFEVDPIAHLALQRELRGSAERVIGHYHSHPNGLARPSDTDLAEANDADLVWVIIGVTKDQTDRDVVINAYRLGMASFEQITLSSF